jgi:hypothetical protein
MPNPNAIVSRQIRIEPPRDGDIAQWMRSGREIIVHLDEGRRVRLDPENPRSPGFAQVLAGLEALGRPAYLEVDPDRENVSEVFVPHVARVVGLRPVEGGHNVELDLSHGQHLLRKDSEDYSAFEAVAREAAAGEAPVILSENEAHEILDIRFFKAGSPADFLPDDVLRPRRPDLLRRIWWWPHWPWWWKRYRCVSLKRAQEVFDAMAATTCNPVAVPPPCIPFMYPDDGCWGRAHEMCRLMIAMGLSPRKVWISLWPLTAATRNHPNCQVVWGWHVAPTLCVYYRRRWPWPWLWGGQTMVIDPSLFTGPVPVATWKSVQNNPNATLTHTPASDFLWGSTDPTYAQTNSVLAQYRLALLNRSNGPSGPPPYANCP